jgi:threonine dehydrogenase-like Zn-dependent dehydrogenase
MKAVVFHGIGDIRLDEVDDPKIKKSDDAIISLTASAICGRTTQIAELRESTHFVDSKAYN